MSTVYRGKYFMVQHHRASAYMQVIRSDAPFESVADATDALSACQAAFSPLEPSRYGLLFDWRRSPISTDRNLHQALATQMDSMSEPFARCAILLATTVGAMQASRVGRTLGNQRMSVFDDEAVAIAWLTHR